MEIKSFTAVSWEYLGVQLLADAALNLDLNLGTQNDKFIFKRNFKRS